MEESPCCRVCHGESEPDNQLFHPCKCDGSIRYVHQDCLVQWLKVSKQNRGKCELCGEKFQFQNVYAAGAPTRLTIFEVIVELMPRIITIAKTILYVIFSSFFWGVCLPLFTNWWIKVCWCVVSESNFGTCSLSIVPLIDTIEHAMLAWYSGVVNICVIIAVSVLFFEMIQIVYREFDIAERNRNMRQLERQLNDNIAGLRRLEEERRLTEVRLMAVCEYESLRHEWDIAKQSTQKNQDNSHAPRTQFQDGVAANLLSDVEVVLREVESSGEEALRSNDDLDDDLQSNNVISDVFENDASGVSGEIPYLLVGNSDDEDEDGRDKQSGEEAIERANHSAINAELVASLRIDIRFTGRMLALLDEICLMAGLEYFAGLRDCYRQVNSLLVRHVEQTGGGAADSDPQAVIEGLVTDPDLRGIVLQRLQETDALSFSLRTPQLSASSSDFVSANRRAKMLLAASQAFNGAPLPKMEEEDDEEGHQAGDPDDVALSLEARGRLMMQQYNEQIDKQKREAAEAIMANRVESAVDSSEVVLNTQISTKLEIVDANTTSIDCLDISVDDCEIEPVLIDDKEVVDVEEEEAAYVASRNNTVVVEKKDHNDILEDPSAASNSTNTDTMELDLSAETSLDLTTHGEVRSASAEESQNVEFVPAVAGENVAVDVLPAVANAPAVDNLAGNEAALPAAGGEIAVIDLVPPGGAVNNNAQNDAAQMQLGIKYLLLCFSFIALFVLFLLVVPAFMGRLLFEGSVVPDAVKARARAIIHGILDQENMSHLLSSKLLGDLESSADSNMTIETRGQIAEAVYLKFKTIVEILVGYGMYVGMFVLGYSIYCMRYLRAVRNVRLPSASAFLAAQTANAQKGMLALSKLSMMLGFYGMVLPLTVAALVSKTLARSISPGFSASLKTVFAGLEAGTDQASFELDPMLVIFAIFLYLFAFVFMGHILVIALELRQLVRKDLLVDFLPKNDPFERRNRVAGAAVGGGQAGVAAFRRANANNANNVNVRVNMVGVNGQQLPQLVLNAANEPNNMQQQVDELHESLVKVSYGRLLRKFLANAAILVPSILMGVIIPLRFGHLLCPLLLSDGGGPLVFRFKSVVMDVQVPVEMVLSHILVPMLLEKMRYKANVRRLLSWFLSAAAPPLGLHWILAPEAFPPPLVAAPDVLPVLQVGVNVPLPIAPPEPPAEAEAEAVIPRDVAEPEGTTTGPESVGGASKSDDPRETRDLDDVTSETAEEVSLICDDDIPVEVSSLQVPVVDVEPFGLLLLTTIDSSSSDSGSDGGDECEIDMKSVSSEGQQEEEGDRDVEVEVHTEDDIAHVQSADWSDQIMSGDANMEEERSEDAVVDTSPIDGSVYGAAGESIAAEDVQLPDKFSSDVVVNTTEQPVVPVTPIAPVQIADPPVAETGPTPLVGVAPPVIQQQQQQPLPSVMNSLPVEIRVGLLVVLGLVLFAVVSSWTLHAPLAVGRQLLSLCRIPPTNDLFNYPAGLIVCWAGSFVLEYVYKDLVHNANAVSVAQVVFKWAGLVGKILALGTVWLLVPPLAVGLFVEALVIIPLRTPLNESPQYPFLQCWAIGLIIFKVWTRCVLTGMFGDIPLRLQFEQILIRGFAQFDATTTLFKVVLPVISRLLDFLLVPYFLARVACLFVQSYLLRTVLVRFSIHIYITVRVLVYATRHVYTYLTTLHNELRDSRYLIGTKLTNREKKVL